MAFMWKRRSQKQSAKVTLAGIIKEMANPRGAMSAREDHHIVLRGFPVVEKQR
jgi:hypothetical protein